MDCDHITSMGREGETGSWCKECGTKVLEVHDRPCSECVHFYPREGSTGMCNHHHMRVIRDMHVTYWLVDGPGRSGLCFQEREA